VKENHIKINIIIISILFILIFIRMWFVLHSDRGEVVSKYGGKVSEVVGYISSEPQVKDFTKVFVLKVLEIDKTKVDISVKVSTDRYLDFDYGQKLRLEGKIQPPFNFKSNGGRIFNYIDFLFKDDIYFEMKKPKIDILVVDVKGGAGGNGNFVSSGLYKIKHGFLSNIKKVMGEPHGALAGGLVVGEKSALGKNLIDDFRKTGLIHIVVLSGYNITIVADSIRRLLSFLPRNIGIIFGSLGIIAFGILVGGGATVVRSCIMAVIALCATLLRRDYNVGKALLIAGAVMVIQNPLILLYDPSFQLSFLATLGLLLLSSPIEKRISFITERLGIRGLIASTLATQIFVSPYILYMMGQLSVIGIVVNILVLPIIPMTMLTVTLTGLIGFVSLQMSQIFAWFSYFLLSYELFIVKFFANLPFASIELPKFSFWIVIGVYSVYFVALSKFSSTFFQFMFKKKSST
jgi:competence protein ComEC